MVSLDDMKDTTSDRSKDSGEYHAADIGVTEDDVLKKTSTSKASTSKFDTHQIHLLKNTLCIDPVKSTLARYLSVFGITQYADFTTSLHNILDDPCVSEGSKSIFLSRLEIAKLQSFKPNSKGDWLRYTWSINKPSTRAVATLGFPSSSATIRRAVAPPVLGVYPLAHEIRPIRLSHRCPLGPTGRRGRPAST